MEDANPSATLITLRKMKSGATFYTYRDGTAQFGWSTEPEARGENRAVMTICREGRLYRVTVQDAGPDNVGPDED